MSHHRPWPYARVLAHRGGGALAPENTIAAIDTGRRYGFTAIECDARLAADDIPVLIHDDTLDRTTDGAGRVAACTAADLTRLDAGRWFSPQFAGVPVPTLAATAAHCRANGIWINLEIKQADGSEVHTGEVVARETARLYADVVHAGGDGADGIDPRVPLLSSFSRATLLGARRGAPDLPRGYLVDDVPAGWREALEAMGCVSLHADHKLLTREAARVVKDAGYWLFCYTVNDPVRAREILSWGVDAFCTDRIDLIGANFEE